jgi:hypothetical protein
MKIIIRALVGLIIFVNQPGTVIVVGDLPVQETTGYNYPALAGASTAGGHEVPADNLVVFRQLQNSPVRSKATGLQLVGPKRGPVK